MIKVLSINLNSTKIWMYIPSVSHAASNVITASVLTSTSLVFEYVVPIYPLELFPDLRM